jgi:hypothetical protein
MLRGEELAGHLGPHPGPVCSGQGSAGGNAGRGVDRSEPSCHFAAEWADVTVNDLERRPEPGRVLVVALGEVGSCQLLLAELGQRVQAAAEQGSHLFGGHRVAAVRASIPAKPEPIHTPGFSPRSV